MHIFLCPVRLKLIVCCVQIQRQIGNAVPLPLANALGRELRAALFQKWKRGQEDAIVIDDVPPSSDDDRMDIS